MSQFSGCFLLLFGQLAVGGVAGLAVPPFAVLDRGFYRSSAGIFLGFALLFLAGKVGARGSRRHAQRRHGGRAGRLGALHRVARRLPVLALARVRTPSGRARSPSALLLGLLALTVSALHFRVGPWLGPATLLYPLAFVTGALVLGAVATGMLLGHWYLIDLGLSIDPLQRLLPLLRRRCSSRSSSSRRRPCS